MSGKRIDKHVPVAVQQFHNATVRGNDRIVMFSMWSLPRCYKQGKKSVDSSVEFGTRVWEDRTSAREAKESRLLEAVVREEVVKTAGSKSLAGSVMIYEL